ncbi:MAG: hypothetical protein K8U57_09110 [Planctomycetes bacterium]|nr:hypothetical protein [Planctomycetota bacterium]
MPRTSWFPLLVLGWAAVMVVSGAVFWFVLRDEGSDEPPPALPTIPEPAPIPQPVMQPTQMTPRRSRAGIDIEIAKLESVVADLKQQEIHQSKQREILASTIKRYGDLVAKGDVRVENELAFFRKTSRELAVKLAQTTAARAEGETQRTTLRGKLKQADEELRGQKVALDTPLGALETLKTVTALQNQIATLDCRIATEADGLAWFNIQQDALLKVLSGQKEALLPAVELLEKWQPPRKGITVLESQINQLRTERDLLMGK